jgi:hypothetical protein
MPYSFLAGATVVLHFTFIVFVIGGAWLVSRNIAWAYVHVPAIAWVAWLEITGATCPLTPLEYSLRAQAGQAGYTGGFIDHYLLPLIYPTGLTASIQIVLGVLVVAGNAIAYAWLWQRQRRGERGAAAS